MGIKHTATKVSGESGYAIEWNDEHIIDSDLDFNFFSGINVGEPINPSDIATKNYVDENIPPSIMSPIGSMVAWLKNLAGTPSLPTGWVECNGQTLSDVNSPYNGQVIPNLNGGNRFLRGNATSGATGGSAGTIAYLYKVGAAFSNYAFPIWTDGDGGPMYASDPGQASLGDVPVVRSRTDYFPTIPPYYNVVWIMRIK